MRVIVRDFRGLENLDADIGGILLLAGANGAGKSSACQAIAAAVSGDVLPYDLTKAKAALLVRDGAKEAVVELGDGEAVAQVRWPSAERAARGPFRDASRIAVGLENPALMPSKERAAWLVGFVGALPDVQTITAHLTEAGVSPERAAEAVDSVTINGWDKAHATAKEDGAKLKGQWERVTGQRFGTQKAAAWRPDGWTEADERDETERLAVCRVDGWQKSLDAEIAKHAVDAAELARLRELAATFDGLATELGTAERNAAEMQACAEAAGKARAACKSIPETVKAHKCPHCGEALEITGGEIHAGMRVAPPISDEEVQFAKRDIAAADAALAAANTASIEAERAVTRLKSKYKQARDAAAKVAAIPAEAPPDRVAETRAGLAAAQQKLTTWRIVRDARAISAAIDQQIIIVKALSEDGIRKAVLVERLGEFNGTLVAVCRQAGWAWANIEPDMSLTYGGRPYSLCSDGEKFRVRVTLQVAAARREKAPLVVIDGADILDRAGRNGLLGMLADGGIPAVVGMTISRRDDMPDLAAAGIGCSVWIERGAAQEIGKVAA